MLARISEVYAIKSVPEVNLDSSFNHFLCVTVALKENK